MTSYTQFYMYVTNNNINELKRSLFDTFNEMNSVEANKWVNMYVHSHKWSDKVTLLINELKNFNEVSARY